MSGVKQVSLKAEKEILRKASDEAMSNPKLRDPESYSQFMAIVRKKIHVVDDQKEREIIAPHHKRENNHTEQEIER